MPKFPHVPKRREPLFPHVPGSRVEKLMPSKEAWQMTREEFGKPYISGITHKGKITSSKVMWFSHEIQQAEYYTLGGKGKIYYAMPKSDAKILDLTDAEVAQDFENKIMELAGQGAYGISGIVEEFGEHEGISEGIVPTDIVEQGGIWDSTAFKNMVWEEFGYDFIKLPDGGIALNTDAMVLSEEPTHKKLVQKALKEGKPVPHEVLKDYPELAKR